ncbi:unnamed protein product, partial [Rotaria sp. Silwood2]
VWIITVGMNTGIMKLVDEIIQINPDRSRLIPVISIATLGCVSGRQHLDVREASLELNHRKFIFIDDETERKHDREIKFRAQLEQTISGEFFSSKTIGNCSNQPGNLSRTSFLRSENSGS